MRTHPVSIGKLVSSGALQFGDGYRTKRSEHGTTGFRIIRVADISNDSISFDGPDFVSSEFAKAIGAKAGRAGDVLLTTKGTVGRVAIMPHSDEPTVYSPQLCYFRVVDKHVLLPQYLRYWFSSMEFWDQATYRMNNTDMAAYINLADIRSMRVTLPPIDEQHAIVEVLGALDDKIAANTKLASTSDELAAALSSHAFESRAEVPLSELAEVTMGSSPVGASLNESGDGTVFYQGIRDFGLRYPSPRIWTTAPVRLAQELDTLLSVRAPVGKVNLAADSVCIGRGIASIRSRLNSPYTLFHAIKSSRVWDQFNSEGTVFGSINRKQLDSVRMKWVTPQDLQAIETRLSSLEQLICSATSAAKTLISMRDALLPQLMSGKLHVKDAEDIVSAAV